jgi:hypothetical protein
MYHSSGYQGGRIHLNSIKTTLRKEDWNSQLAFGVIFYLKAMERTAEAACVSKVLKITKTQFFLGND